MTAASIIIPVYDVEAYLPRCLRSVAAQTAATQHEMEVIVVDDRGHDSSGRLAREFIEAYRGPLRWHLITHEHNMGLSEARNSGLRAATGRYVFFLDSDDSLRPDCMERFLQVAGEHPGVDMVQGLYAYDPPRAYAPRYAALPPFTADRALIKRLLLSEELIPCMAQNRLVRRRLLIDNGLTFRPGIIHEDMHWDFFLAKHVQTLALQPEPCYIYTHREGSIMATWNRAKERHACLTMLTDFAAAIDPFMPGTQKAALLRQLRRMHMNSLADTPREMRHACRTANGAHGPLESLLCTLATTLPPRSTLSLKSYHLLLKLYGQ